MVVTATVGNQRRACRIERSAPNLGRTVFLCSLRYHVRLATNSSSLRLARSALERRKTNEDIMRLIKLLAGSALAISLLGFAPVQAAPAAAGAVGLERTINESVVEKAHTRKMRHSKYRSHRHYRTSRYNRGRHAGAYRYGTIRRAGVPTPYGRRGYRGSGATGNFSGSGR